MAYSPEQWKKAKVLFELGKSLQEIADELDFKDRTAISRKAKKDKWEKAKTQQLKDDIVGFEKEKATLEAKNATLVAKLSTLEDFDITIIKDVIENETKSKSILLSTANLSLIRKNQILTKNTKTVIEFETTYSDDGKPLLKRPIEFEVELSPSDIKLIDEGIDKNAVTLEHAPRHASSQINLQNNIQNNVQSNLTLDDFYEE